jgi:hypothetical protein
LINYFTEETPLDDYEHYKGRLEEALEHMLKLDDTIHDLLADDEYDKDVTTCEEYIETAKHAIQRANRGLEERLSVATAASTLGQIHLSAVPTQPVLTQSPRQHIKLPAIKLEPFSGDVEGWARFWEQFESSIDTDPSLSTVNKHVFLRGYLEGEPKRLIEGIAVTASTYEDTKRILRARYGDRNRIIQAHLDYLEDITPISTASPEMLNTTFIECNRRIQALQALGEDVNAYGRVLAPKILRAFPDDICRRWIVHVKREQLSEGDILKLMDFVSDEVDEAITTQKIRGDPFNLASAVPTTATLQVHSRPGKSTQRTKEVVDPFCVFCEQRGHWAQDCKRVRNVHERIGKLKASNRCFLCLNRGHNAKNCNKKGRASCSQCRKGHHRSICNDSDRPTPNDTSIETTSVGKIDVTSSGFTHLQTARIRITGPTGLSKLTRCVLDGGSQCSFIGKSLVDQLRLEVIADRPLTVNAFETSSGTSNSRRFVRLSVTGIWSNSKVPLTAFETTHAFAHHSTVPRDINMIGQTRKLQLADPTDEPADLPIEMLIGGDQYWKIVKDAAPIRLSQSLVLLPSLFGWILSANRSGVSVNSTTVNFIDVPHEPPPCDDALRRFWDLETIGITSEQGRAAKATDTAFLGEFHASYCL